MGILDFFFPKYCVSCKKIGSYICSNCFSFISFDTAETCLVCGRLAIGGVTHLICKGRYTIDGSFNALAYKGVVKKLIYTFKYKPYVTDLASVLGDLFYESLIQKEKFMQILETKPIFVPIPLHNSKLKSRGYNHALILAKELAKRFQLPVANLLVRVRKTSSQFGLNREDRKENIHGAFALRLDSGVVPTPVEQANSAFGLRSRMTAEKSLNIFLVDDIITTGATMSEAAKILKKSGAKQIWGIALARD